MLKHSKKLKKKKPAQKISGLIKTFCHILNRGAELNKHLGLKDKGDHPAT